MSKHETYTLTIRAVPDRMPAVARLRRLLKSMLRGFGFRVVRIVEGERISDSTEDPK